MAPRSGGVRRVRRVEHLVGDDQRVTRLDHRVGRRRAEHVHRAEEDPLERLRSGRDRLGRRAVARGRALVVGRRVDAVEHLSNVPHRRHVDLAVVVLLEDRRRAVEQRADVGVLERRARAADVGDRVGVATEVAVALAQLVRVDDVVAEARVVGDGEGPHVGLALVERAALRALEPRDRARDRVHAFVVRDGPFEREVVEVEAVAVARRVDDDRRVGARELRDDAGQVQSERVVEPEHRLREVGVRRVGDLARRDVERQIDVRDVDRCRQRHGRVRVLVRERALAEAAVQRVARAVQVVDVLQQVGHEEERVDLVLVLGRLGELVALVRAPFEVRRVVDAEVPRAARRLRERQLGRQRVVDERVVARERAFETGRDICRMELPELDALLAERRAVGADADRALVLELLGDGRVLRIDVGGERQRAGRVLREGHVVLTRDDLARVRVDRDQVEPERVGRELRDLPDEPVAVGGRVDAEPRLERVDHGRLRGEVRERGREQLVGRRGQVRGEAAEVDLGGVASGRGVERRRRVDRDVAEIRPARHHHLIARVQHEPDAAIFDVDAAEGLLEAEQVAAEGRLLFREPQRRGIGDSEERGVVGQERAAGLLGRARVGRAREVHDDVGRSAEVVPSDADAGRLPFERGERGRLNAGRLARGRGRRRQIEVVVRRRAVVHVEAERGRACTGPAHGNEKREPHESGEKPDPHLS